MAREGARIRVLTLIFPLRRLLLHKILPFPTSAVPRIVLRGLSGPRYRSHQGDHLGGQAQPRCQQTRFPQPTSLPSGRSPRDNVGNIVIRSFVLRSPGFANSYTRRERTSHHRRQQQLNSVRTPVYGGGQTIGDRDRFRQCPLFLAGSPSHRQRLCSTPEGGADRRRPPGSDGSDCHPVGALPSAH